jgi:hypothetical protein
MDIAVCFWGLVRSGKWTHKSIKEQLDIMRTFGKVTVFMHTYKVTGKYSNQHANEKNITLDNDEYKLFDPDHFIFDDQDEITRQLNFEEYRTFPDLYKTDYQTIDNLIKSLYSQRRVTDLMLRHHKTKKYTHVVYMRPDVKWILPLKLSQFKIEEDMIVSPQFHSKHGEGNDFSEKINDRFAICTPTVATIYGRRLKFLLAYSKQKQIQSETFLYDVMVAHNIDIVFKWICFNRVRADGRVLQDCKSKY